MPATTPQANLAARMGRWSADHWKTATFGWLAFVVVAFALGMAGTKSIDPNTAGPRESGRMDRILDAGFKRPAGESVLIQSRSLATTDPAFTAAVGDVVARHLQARCRPERPHGPGLQDGHSALVEFEIRGPADEAAAKIDPVLAQVDAAQKAHPQLYIGEFGMASAVDALAKTVEEDLGKAGMLSLPITLVILVIAFGALVAAGIPLLLALTAVFATFGVVGGTSHVFPMANEAGALVLLIGLAVGVDYSLFYLKREREERAAGRSERAALEAAAATSGRSVLISGLTVMTAMAGMFLTGDPVVRVVRHRHDRGGRDRDDRLADRAARAAVAARRPRRPGPDPARRPASPRRRRGPDLGRDRQRRPAPAAAVGRPRRWPAGGARDPGPPAPHGQARPRHVPAVASRRADVRADAAGVPRLRPAGQRGRQGRRRQLARRCRPRSSGSGSGRSRPAACTSRSPSTSTTTARSRTSRSDRRQGHRRRLERVARAAARTRSCRRRSAPFPAPRQASPAQPPSGRTARTR